METIDIPIEESQKRELEEIADAIGMDLQTLFMVFAKKLLHERKMPFDFDKADAQNTVM